MKRTIVQLVAVLVFVGASGCSSDEPVDEPASHEETTTSTPTSTPAGEPEECLSAVDDWLALYDALAEASTLEDPTKEMTIKVVDDSKELFAELRKHCNTRLAYAASVAQDQMLRVDATITACEFSEFCGSQVDDELDLTMEAVDEVRAMVE